MTIVILLDERGNYNPKSMADRMNLPWAQAFIDEQIEEADWESLLSRKAWTT